MYDVRCALTSLAIATAGFQGRANIASLLIAHGLNPSDLHGDGFTPLHRYVDRAGQGRAGQGVVYGASLVVCLPVETCPKSFPASYLTHGKVIP